MNRRLVTTALLVAFFAVAFGSTAHAATGQTLRGNAPFEVDLTVQIPDYATNPSSGGTALAGLTYTPSDTIGNGFRIDIAPVGSPRNTWVALVDNTSTQVAEIVVPGANLTPNVPHVIEVVWDGEGLSLSIDGTISTAGRDGQDITGLVTAPLQTGDGSGSSTAFVGEVTDLAITQSAEELAASPTPTPVPAVMAAPAASPLPPVAVFAVTEQQPVAVAAAELPNTGLNVSAALGGAIALIFAGATLMLVTRKEPRSPVRESGAFAWKQSES